VGQTRKTTRTPVMPSKTSTRFTVPSTDCSKQRAHWPQKRWGRGGTGCLKSKCERCRLRREESVARVGMQMSPEIQKRTHQARDLSSKSKTFRLSASKAAPVAVRRVAPKCRRCFIQQHKPISLLGDVRPAACPWAEPRQSGSRAPSGRCGVHVARGPIDGSRDAPPAMPGRPTLLLGGAGWSGRRNLDALGGSGRLGRTRKERVPGARSGSRRRRLKGKKWKKTLPRIILCWPSTSIKSKVRSPGQAW